MATSLISIIVPVFNNEKTLSRCLDSILSQTISNYEVIIVDDGSIDDTPIIAKNYSLNDSRIKIFKQENRGLGAARNTGLKETRSPYIAFVDSDDFIEPNMLEEMHYMSKSSGSPVINCEASIDVVDHSQTPTTSSILKFPFKASRLTGIEAFTYFAALVPPVLNSVCFKLIRRDLLKDNAIYFPESFRFAEDMTVSARCFLQSPIVSFVHQPLYHYVRSNSVLTSTYSIKKANDLIDNMNEIVFYAKKANYPSSLDEFQLEMLFSATRQVVWSRNTKSPEGKKVLAKIMSLSTPLCFSESNIEIPLFQKIKMKSVSANHATLLCSLAYKLRKMPFIKNYM